MTLSFIAFHMRDYQRDTQQLPLEGHGAYFLLLQHCWTHGRIPLDDASCAAICKVSVQRWRKQLLPLVAGYFDENGENKRATAEIAKVEKMRLQRAVAGHNGGAAAQLRKAQNQAAAIATVKLPSSGREAIKRDIDNPFTEAARARDPAAENSFEKSTPETAALPAGFAEKAREAVQQNPGKSRLVDALERKGKHR